jgi:hypothetical protein
MALLEEIFKKKKKKKHTEKCDSSRVLVLYALDAAGQLKAYHRQT